MNTPVNPTKAEMMATKPDVSLSRVARKMPPRRAVMAIIKPQNCSQFLTFYVRINNFFFYGEAVIVLSLGHPDYSFGGCRDDLILSF